MESSIRFSFAAVCMFFLALVSASAQPSKPDPNFWVTDGPVHVIAKHGWTVYIGGNFTRVGPNAPYGTSLSASSGMPDLSFVKPNGNVSAVVPDGSGGWYIGGEFTRVGGEQRKHVARVKADGSLHPWNPEVNGTVLTLALKNGSLFLGGEFSAVNGLARSGFAALDTETGYASPWVADANGTVRAVAVHGGKVYLGGDFTKLNGQTRNHIAALDLANGSLGLWNADADDRVNTILAAGNKVLVGGDFTSIGGQSRNRIAAVDTTAGTAVPGTWNPNANGSITSMALKGEKVYVGGDFTEIGGQARNRIASLDESTGVTDGFWNPNANGRVLSISVSGDTVYAGGQFTMVEGRSRSHLASLSVITGSCFPWNPNPGRVVRAISAMGARVYAGGDFLTIGAKTRNNIAALDAFTGVATDWDPDANGTVRAIAMHQDRVYVGGDFNRIGDAARSLIASLHVNTGKSTPWNPDASGSGGEGAPGVRALAVHRDRVFAGGSFLTIGGQERRNLAALDANTGMATSWRPDPDAVVFSLALAPGGMYPPGDTVNYAPGDTVVYVGGPFENIGRRLRFGLASIYDDPSGTASTWFPWVNDRANTILSPANSNVLFIGGGFVGVGVNSTHRYIAQVDRSTAVPTPWYPLPNGDVLALDFKYPFVYAGGSFTSIGGASRNHIAAVGLDGSVLSWNPDANATTRSLVLSGDTVFAGGDFTTMGDMPQPFFAAFTGVTEVDPGFGGTIAASQSGVAPFDPAPFVEVEPPSGHSGGLVYQWQVSTESDSTGFMDIPGATSPAYDPDSMGTTSFFRRMVAILGRLGCCGIPSNVLKVQIAVVKSWSGGNGNWSDPGNWSGGAVPVGSDVIFILNGNPRLDVDFTVMNRLVVSGAGGLIIMPGRTLRVAGVADFGNRPIVFRSDASGTAQLGEVTGSLLNACRVTVERFIPATGRRWRLLTAPLDSVTVRDGWQNGQSWNGVGTLASDGTGTLITGQQQGTAAIANGRGFDFWSAISNSSASILTYGQGQSQGFWSTVPNTTAPKAFNGNKAYLLFVRGPRGNAYAGGTANASTTLRPTGCLRFGEVPIPIDGTKGFTLVGNPYASQIDFNSFYSNPINSDIIKRQMWMWDATSGSGSNFIAVVYSGGRYVEVPRKFHAEGHSSPLTAIQSGHGFFVIPKSPSSGTLLIHESDKIGAQPANPNILLGEDLTPRLFLNLIKRDAAGGELLADGVMAAYGSGYSMKSIDAEDAVKLENPEANLSIENDGVSLVADARPLSGLRDPISLRLWNITSGAYRFEAKLERMEERGLKAFLEDRHTGIRTPLEMNGGVTAVEFGIGSDEASRAEGRFRIIFEQAAMNASFAPEMEGMNKAMTVYPNPLTGSTLNARLQNLPPGAYTLQLLANDGKVLATANIRHEGGTSIHRIELVGTLPKGVYQVRCLSGGKCLVIEELASL